jgi:hypothetical protein
MKSHGDQAMPKIATSPEHRFTELVPRLGHDATRSLLAARTAHVLLVLRVDPLLGQLVDEQRKESDADAHRASAGSAAHVVAHIRRPLSSPASLLIGRRPEALRFEKHLQTDAKDACFGRRWPLRLQKGIECSYMPLGKDKRLRLAGLPLFGFGRHVGFSLLGHARILQQAISEATQSIVRYMVTLICHIFYMRLI